MDALKHHKNSDFHMTTLEVIILFLIGVAAIGSIWLFTGLLIGLFVL
ncbi:hypothetical protein ACFLYW_02515 [Thermodesulfobacteriota bacterium]